MGQISDETGGKITPYKKQRKLVNVIIIQI